jgi:hypothetical protein
MPTIAISFTRSPGMKIEAVCVAYSWSHLLIVLLPVFRSVHMETCSIIGRCLARTERRISRLWRAQYSCHGRKARASGTQRSGLVERSPTGRGDFLACVRAQLRCSTRSRLPALNPHSPRSTIAMCICSPGAFDSKLPLTICRLRMGGRSTLFQPPFADAVRQSRHAM